MSSNKGFTFTLFAVLGAIAGYATYMASQNEFSNETVDNYDTVVNKFKNVGNDIQRTYTSIGDNSKFHSNADNLSISTKKLALSTGDLVKSATSDMYEHAKASIKKTIDTINKNNSVHSSKPNKTKNATQKKASPIKKTVKKKGNKK